MTSRRAALAIAAAGVITVVAGDGARREAQAGGRPTAMHRLRARPSAIPPAKPAHSFGPSHALTGGKGPLGSVISTGSAAVALTFDDGPDPVTTPQLLDLLGQHHIKATFNLVGWRARDNAPVVRRMGAEGHTICNHSWQHLMDLGKRPLAYQKWDLSQTTEMINRAAPDSPVRYMRAPGGNFTPRLVDLIRQFGMSPLFWNVDPRDWDSAHYGSGPPMVSHIVSSVQAQVKPGRIVLSHDCKHPDTIAAYATLLPWLKARYTLIALPT
jgi:peptidoglycan/xylan/chitin deacetylase (PgdA/CDA1 family)